MPRQAESCLYTPKLRLGKYDARTSCLRHGGTLPLFEHHAAVHPVRRLPVAMGREKPRKALLLSYVPSLLHAPAEGLVSRASAPVNSGVGGLAPNLAPIASVRLCAPLSPF